MQHRESASPDPQTVLARARAASFEAERLAELALQTRIEAMLALMRAQAVPVSPVVEARLHLLLGRTPAQGQAETSTRKVRPGSSASVVRTDDEDSAAHTVEFR